jgi:hypothetical protein
MEGYPTAFAGAQKERSRFPTVRIRLEALEDRVTPATFTVTSLDDTDDADPGDGKALDANKQVPLRSASRRSTRWPRPRGALRWEAASWTEPGYMDHHH